MSPPGPRPLLLVLLVLSGRAWRCEALTLSLGRLSVAVRDVCASLTTDDEWPAPEDVGWMSSQAIAAEQRQTRAAEGAEPLAQGEFQFAEGICFDHRYEIVEPLAYEGDSRAQQTLGLLLYGGVGGAAQDAKASAEWHAAAAAQGNVDALAVLGGCLRNGVGISQNERLGLTLIEAAAAGGSPVGLVKLGGLYDEGASGVACDPWEAVQLYERAAEQGSALGHFNLGWAYVHGIGVRRDVEEGLAQWAKAAALAPDDGAEEAAYHLYEERKLVALVPHLDIDPVASLQLSSSLGFDKAVRKWERREQRRALGPEFFGKGRKGERFIRNDKARSFTAKELRAEEGL
jgi:TPR repeat protein